MVHVSYATILSVLTLAESQLWKFIYTDMPGVFYIATKENTDLVLTVPENVQAGNPSYAPRLEEIKKDYADSHQLWRLVPSGDGPLSIIQNYDYLNGNGQVLDTNLGNAEGQLVFMYTRCDSDDQKWYFQCQYAT